MGEFKLTSKRWILEMDSIIISISFNSVWVSHLSAIFRLRFDFIFVFVINLNLNEVNLTCLVYIIKYKNKMK